MGKDKPYWWPDVIDSEHLNRLRADYPEHAEKDDYELLNYFDEGKGRGEYSTTWDHVGDAYSDYRKLADAFLLLVAETGKQPSDFDT